MRRNVWQRCTAALACALFLGSVADAHHSFTEFDARKTVEITGTLSDFAWQNPHVRLQVQVPEGGQKVAWDVELHSVGILSRMNFTPQVFKTGQTITLAGNPSRTKAHRMFATNALVAKGKEVIIAPGSPPRWGAGAPLPPPAQVANVSAPPVKGLFHVWASSFTDPAAGPYSLWNGELPLTAAAKKALASWDPVRQTIAKGCEPKGMPTIMEQPYGLAFEDLGKTIAIHMEEYDTVRVVHMSDGVAVPKTKSLLGHSAGRWEGSTLVVTTTGTSWPYIAPSGLPQGPTSSMVERFTPNQDSTRLEYTVTITDPDTFTVPAVMKRAWVWNPNERVQKYRCGQRQNGR